MCAIRSSMVPVSQNNANHLPQCQPSKLRFLDLTPCTPKQKPFRWIIEIYTFNKLSRAYFLCTLKLDSYRDKGLLNKCLVTLEHQCVECTRSTFTLGKTNYLWKNISWALSPISFLRENDNTKPSYFSFLFSLISKIQTVPAPPPKSCHSGISFV